MQKAILCMLAGIGLLFYAFPILRGGQRAQPLTPDQKIWRVLVVITASLLLGVGGWLLRAALHAKGR